ncbi:M48 family peptidase [Sesbania bispinosa]|nr:M48 family peptidase [Sesbania bispinosa]
MQLVVVRGSTGQGMVAAATRYSGDGQNLDWSSRFRQWLERDATTGVDGWLQRSAVADTTNPARCYEGRTRWGRENSEDEEQRCDGWL